MVHHIGHGNIRTVPTRAHGIALTPEPTSSQVHTIPMVCYPCLSSSKHPAECMGEVRLDLITQYGVFIYCFNVSKEIMNKMLENL